MNIMFFRALFPVFLFMPLALPALAGALAAATGSDKEQRIFLQADKTVAYGELMGVMNALRAAGYLKIALVGLEARPGQ